MPNTETVRPETINRPRVQAELALAMMAGMQLDVFTPLRDGPLKLESIAAALNVNDEKLGAVLYALAAGGLLELENGAFSNTDEAHKFLVKGRPEYIGGVAGNLAFRWRAIMNTAESIRTGVPQAKQDYSEDDQESLERFLRGLQDEASANGRELAQLLDLSSAKTVADIGGGSGGLAIALTALQPHLKATVVELPGTTPITRKIIAEAGAGARVDTRDADLLSGPLSGSYDVVVARALLQVFSKADAATVARHIASAVAPGGSLHIIGRMLDDTRLAPLSSVGFNLLTLNIFDAGGAYTESENVDWLSAAGLQEYETVQLGAGYTMVSAKKPRRS